MPRTALLGAVLFVFTLVPPAWSADAAILPGESRTTAARLIEVHKKIDDKKYTEAIDELQAILDSAGNDLVPLTSEHCVQARRLCHRELSKLPPEALREYRSRVDPQAKKWLDEALLTREVRLLRRVVDEALCSRSGETAADLLGDLAFERGQFDEAITWWRLLAPPLDANKDKRNDQAFFYPDRQGDKARLYAKQIVALIFAGAREDAARNLKAFQKEYPNAEGTLGGRKGKYTDLLQDVFKETPLDTDKAWTTFGGDATRGLVLPAPPRWLERLAATVKEGPTWRFNLQTRKPLDESPLTPPDTNDPHSVRARKMAFQPLICGHYVIVGDAQFVTAYDLTTGKEATWYDVTEKKINALAPPNLKLPTKAVDLRYTLTAADGYLYVRLGAQNLFRPDDKEVDKDNKIASFLACLSLDPAAKENRLRWCTSPQVLPGNAIFEGAPLVHNGMLYIAVTWFEGDRTLTAIRCYPAGTDTLPQKRWQQTVCETRELKPKEQRSRHHLLTIAGPNVVYCSHSGAIVAVDALTGKTAWAVRYPSEPPTNADEPSLRDLTPCLYAAGRLYAAPADYDHLLCLDPLTGGTLWEREHIAATHLLGVGKDRLIFTLFTGLRAVNAANGSDKGGWFLPGGGGTMTPMGRGFLIGDVVVWPAVVNDTFSDNIEMVFVRRQEDGATPTDTIAELNRVPVGNLVYSNGVLAVADRTTLSVFVPLAMQRDQRREAREPAAPSKGERAPAARGPSQTPAPRFDDTRSWSLPWERSEEKQLDPGKRLLALPGFDEGSFVTDENGQVTFHPREVARKGWTVTLPFQPTTGWIDGERLLLAGSGGLLALQMRDGEKLWAIPRSGCSDFQFAAGRIFFLENEERLFAVDAATGDTLWTKWAIGAKLHLSPPLGHFHPQITLLSTALLVQPTPGRLWLLDAATGNLLHEESHRFEPWPQPPVAIDENTAVVVLDSRTIVLFDGTTGKSLWKYVAPEVTTLTGEAPQLVVDRENIVLLMPNNIGCTLQRLDRATGKPLWEKPPLLETKTPHDGTGWSLDKDAVYYVQDQVLTARALADGNILWRQALTGADGGWRTRRIGDAVLAYPAETGARRFQFRWLGFSVQWETDHSREAGVGRGVPVICCDAKSGRLRQRLNLLAGPPRVRTRLGFLSRAAALSRLEAPLQLIPTRSDLLVALDSHFWRFTPTPSGDR